MKKRYDVFISYRRDKGGEEFAQLIESELEKRGCRTFLDVKCLKNQTFGPQLLGAIDSAPVFVFILSENCLDRCVELDDWVRREIMYAVEKKKQIVPVNPKGRFKVFPEGLPSEIYTALSETQQSEIHTGQMFISSMNKMVKERIYPYRRRWLKRMLVAILTLFILLSVTVAVREYRYKDYMVQYEYYWSKYIDTQNPEFKEQADLYWEKASSIKENKE